jgi:hypothetical protein
MKICLELSVDELATLVSLAADQLFRKEFIDTRMPGFHTNAEELQFSKDLVKRLRGFLEERRKITNPGIEQKPGRRSNSVQLARAR